MGTEILSGRKILIVEDDSSSRLYLNKILEKYGVIILNAGDGSEAIDIVMNNPDLDIILMDIQLPGIDGYASTIKIREVKPEVIIIAQTAYGLLTEREKLTEAGFNDFIIKPILSKNLIEMLISNLKS